MIDQVLATLGGLFQDPALGLASKVNALAAAKGFSVNATDPSRSWVRTDFRWEPWSLSGHLAEADLPIITIAPLRYTVQRKAFPATGIRDARPGVRITGEFFDGDAQRLSDTVVTVAGGVIQVLDNVEEYSRNHAGTIALLEDAFGDFATDFIFGDFAGPVTKTGFTADMFFRERGTQ